MNNFIISTTTCSFYNPKIWDGSIPLTKQDIFDYSSSTCITNFSSASGTLATMTYGDVLISFFLFLMILGSIFSFIIYHFLTKRPAK